MFSQPPVAKVAVDLRGKSGRAEDMRSTSMLGDPLGLGKISANVCGAVKVRLGASNVPALFLVLTTEPDKATLCLFLCLTFQMSPGAALVPKTLGS
jgi:hypothetical protein